MPNLNERVELSDMVCPYCHERGSALLLTDNAHLMRRFVTSKGIVYIHLKCQDTIIHEWVEQHVRKQI